MRKIPWWLIAIVVITGCLAFLILTWREPDLLMGLLKTAVSAGAGVTLWETGRKVRTTKEDVP